jgi:hypothetical protein
MMRGIVQRHRRSVVAGVLVAIAATAAVALVVVAPASSKGQDGPCRISGGYGAVFHDQPLPDGSFGYRGVIILRTRACGDGPKGIDGTFRPVSGSPATCTPVETPRIDESRCEFTASLGLALAGTPVVIAATGHTSGAINDHVHDDDTIEKLQEAKVQPGVDVRSSECVLLLPEDGGRSGCTLF